MNLELWHVVTGALGLTTSGGILGIFFDRKKRQNEAKQSESNALQTMQKAYDTFTADMKEKYDSVKTEMVEVKNENREQRSDLRALQKDNSKLHLEVAQLTRENHELKQMVAELRQENIKLLKELEKYKKK
jgi:chromosome segregation ATPase